MPLKFILTIGVCLMIGSIAQAKDIIIKTSWEYNTTIKGIASFYTIKSSGRITANGEKYDENLLTCAFNDAPFNSFLKVTNLANGKWIYCRINDRGGFEKYNHIIDLTPEGFSRIADLKEGIIYVQVEILKGE